MEEISNKSSFGYCQLATDFHQENKLTINKHEFM